METSELRRLKVWAIVDARGEPCPGPLLDVKMAIQELPQGKVLEVRVSDPCAPEDIRIWARKAGYECLGSLRAKGYERLFITRNR
ncbi:MAG: sulfurtransferase TusA family protein [Desulfomonilaceae bacterium]